jgi:hypothetical protein
VAQRLVNVPSILFAPYFSSSFVVDIRRAQRTFILSNPDADVAPSNHINKVPNIPVAAPINNDPNIQVAAPINNVLNAASSHATLPNNQNTSSTGSYSKKKKEANSSDKTLSFGQEIETKQKQLHQNYTQINGYISSQLKLRSSWLNQNTETSLKRDRSDGDFKKRRLN